MKSNGGFQIYAQLSSQGWSNWSLITLMLAGSGSFIGMSLKAGPAIRHCLHIARNNTQDTRSSTGSQVRERESQKRLTADGIQRASMFTHRP